MNAALLLSCGLLCSQTAGQPDDLPDVDGMYSVLVKTTSLIDTPLQVADVTGSTAPTQTAPTQTADVASVTPGDLTAVPPMHTDGPDSGDLAAAPSVATPLADGQSPQIVPGTQIGAAPALLVPDATTPAAFAPATTVQNHGQFVPDPAETTSQLVASSTVVEGIPDSVQMSSADAITDISALEPAGVPANPVSIATTQSAAQVLHEALPPSLQTELSGTPLYLQEVLAGSPDRRARLQALSSYWQLTTAVAHYHFAVDEHQRFARIGEPEDARQAVRFQAARAESAASLRDAELSAVSLQFALAELIPQRLNSEPVLPGDKPLVGEYTTRFDSLFVGRPAPAGLRRIHQTLPLRRAAMDARAAAVVAATMAARLIESAYNAGEVGLDDILRAIVDLRKQRTVFLAAVRDYNTEIATYALSVAAENAAPETLVSMLIETPPRDEAVVAAGHQFAPGTPAIVPVAASAGVPTLATRPAPAIPPVTPAVVPTHVLPPAGAMPIGRPEDGISPQINMPNAMPGDGASSPFRDVTPSQPVRPEVLVPTEPARYRSFRLPPGG